MPSDASVLNVVLEYVWTHVKSPAIKVKTSTLLVLSAVYLLLL